MSARNLSSLGARIVLQNRKGGGQALDDAGTLVVNVVAIESGVVARTFDVDIDEVPPIGVVPFWREFEVIGSI
ncbi:hypothetical protein N2603_38440 [Bradyrhizobium huanghuaihaiense]|uniref:hypothetical protein n=1 Tax=Bradyrhizobium huanghuaihaiense TaxID=990078 RepID=UPI0021AAC9FB|nr:hypothetical protein [Bradyrhizobium sp. CB3035]UWU75787.1 hypothetical protein N2603_38440 [Bradyrhizobium sp. CB3035]